MRKKVILIAGFCVIMLTGNFLKQTLVSLYAQNEKTLTAEQAAQMAEASSDGIRQASIRLVKKQIELKQAKDGIRDTRKKENTVRFSLLFNIKFPEKHGLPKEIELIMKVPEIQTDILVLQQQKIYEAIQSKTAGKKAFYEVLLGQYESAFYEKRLKEARMTADRIQKQYEQGTGTKEDADYADGIVQEYEKELGNAQTSYYRSKEALGELIGEDVRFSYIFEESIPEQKLSRSELEQAVQYALKHDFGYYEARKKQDYAKQKVSEVLGIYESQYSKYLGEVKKYLNTHQGKQIDYEEFIQVYNDTLTKIDSPWDGAYVINLIFFKIRIPKEWFKGEYSGTRYLEDQKYALFVALVEEEQAQKSAEQTKAALVASIRDSFEVLKQMQSALTEAKENLEQREQAYELALKSNQKGLTSFSSLEAAKQNLYQQQRNLFEMRIEYAKALESFNEITAGYVEALLQGTAGEPQNDYESGDSFLQEEDEEDEDSQTPSWYLIPDTTGYRFMFGVKIPSQYEVDSYELYYQDTIIGSRQVVTKPLVHLGLTYEDTSLLELKFYRKDQPVYLSYIDGGTYEGELTLTALKEAVSPFENPEEGMAVGEWSFLSQESLLGDFEFAVNSYYEYEEYILRYQTTEIARGKKGESLKTLSLYFSNPEDLAIDLYQNGEKTRTFTFVSTGEGSGNLIYSKPKTESSTESRIETVSVFSLSEKEEVEVRPDAAQFPDQTLVIGTHAIALNAITEELFELACKSAEESGQTKIYYKSDLTSGVWYDITLASDVKGIMGEGTAVTNQEINDLLLMYYTKPSKVTVCFGAPKGSTVYISDLTSPALVEHLTECNELKKEQEIQKQLYENTSKEDYKIQMESLSRVLEEIKDPKMDAFQKQIHALEDLMIYAAEQNIKQELSDTIQKAKEEQKEKQLLFAYIALKERINKEIEGLDFNDNMGLIEKYTSSLTSIEATINELQPSSKKEDALSEFVSKAKEQMISLAQKKEYDKAAEQLNQIAAAETIWEEDNSAQTQQIQMEILAEVIDTTADVLLEQARLGENEQYRKAKENGEKKEVLEEIKEEQLLGVKQTLSDLDSYYENLILREEDPTEKVALHKEKEALDRKLLLQVKDSDLADELSECFQEALSSAEEETNQMLLFYSTDYQEAQQEVQKAEQARKELNLKYLDAVDEKQTETVAKLETDLAKAEQDLENAKEKLEQIQKDFADGILMPDLNISGKEEELQKKSVEKELKRLAETAQTKELSEEEKKRYQQLLEEKLELEVSYFDQVTQEEQLLEELSNQPEFILEELPEWKEAQEAIAPLNDWLKAKEEKEAQLALTDDPNSRLELLEQEQQTLSDSLNKIQTASKKAQKEKKPFVKAAADCGVKVLKAQQANLERRKEKEEETLAQQKEVLQKDTSKLSEEDAVLAKQVADAFTISQMEEEIERAKELEAFFEAEDKVAAAVLPWNFIIEGVTQQPLVLSKSSIEIKQESYHEILVPAQELILAFGGTFSYSMQNSVLVLRGQGKLIELIPGKTTWYLNDRKKTLSTAPIQKEDGTIYVPMECFELAYHLETAQFGDYWISKKES